MAGESHHPPFSNANGAAPGIGAEVSLARGADAEKIAADMLPPASSCLSYQAHRSTKPMIRKVVNNELPP